MDQRLEATAAKVSETARAGLRHALHLDPPDRRQSRQAVGHFSSTLSQIGGIVGRFEDHSKVLGQASDLLAAAQSNLVSTLEERQDALRTLSVGLVQRSEEIERTMRALEGFVDGAFQRARNAPVRLPATCQRDPNLLRRCGPTAVEHRTAGNRGGRACAIRL